MRKSDLHLRVLLSVCIFSPEIRGSQICTEKNENPSCSSAVNLIPFFLFLFLFRLFEPLSFFVKGKCRFGIPDPSLQRKEQKQTATKHHYAKHSGAICFCFFACFFSRCGFEDHWASREKDTNKKQDTNMQSTLAHFLFVLFVFHIVLSDLFFPHRLSKLLSIFPWMHVFPCLIPRRSKPYEVSASARHQAGSVGKFINFHGFWW